MNVTDYTFLINKPDTINEKQTEALHQVLEDFPYFLLEGLHKQWIRTKTCELGNKF